MKITGNSGMVCQRCLLNTMSNRTMLASTECGADNHRFISQRQYKRKLRKDCPSYATMERKGSKVKKNDDEKNNKKESIEDVVTDDQDTAGKHVCIVVSLLSPASSYYNAHNLHFFATRSLLQNFWYFILRSKMF